MANKDFNEWISNFRESIAGYSYYVDFEKVVCNVDKIKVELNMLNSLIGSKNIRQEFCNLVRKYPEVLKCIPILIAVRSNEISITEEGENLNFNFKEPNYTIEQYAQFMDNIGLFEMMGNHITNNLYDYVLGIETGLDSNGRKNRGGHVMEDLVEKYLKKTGKKVYKEMYLEEIERRFGLDLSTISNNGSSTKRFDFVLEGENCVYGIEVNFYTGGGSKLNETARSYKMLAEEAAGLENFKFVWITDGKGWFTTKGNLKETFDTMEHIYCIKDLEESALNRLC
ncbi:MAG: type II restriction endonuclease [Methanomassiliicoccales archaeon]|uniref:type II restriction endonuclease n=1 Tax=Candidatus Methanarcanum hacksteinii TaxID=2911857 RepID=UPI0026FE0471|nr:type II restriction endonuclease [Methanomassiliicoccales archaeon]TQS77773.1 MAG: restriction endonuclease [Candidatus Methanarcanum hacksteinii]